MAKVEIFSTQQLDRLNSACKNEPRVLAIFLFGSQVDGYATNYSDVDLAILLSESLPLSGRLAFEVELCQAVDRQDLDILILNEASISLRFRAISGQVLYEQSLEAVSDFIQHTLLEYYDFQHILETYQREFTKSLEQDYDL